MACISEKDETQANSTPKFETGNDKRHGVNSDSPPIISLTWPNQRNRRVKLAVLYTLLAMSLLSLMEWNPWTNHSMEVENLKGVSEDREWQSLIDIPWTEVQDFRYEDVNITSGFKLENCNYNEFGYRIAPERTENVNFQATTSDGTNITIHYTNRNDISLSYPSEIILCEMNVQNASMVLLKSGDQYTIHSMGIAGREARMTLPWGWVNWALLGLISSYFLLKNIPTGTMVRNSKLRSENLGKRDFSDDEWVFYDSWDMVASEPGTDQYEQGNIIAEHPTKLHPVMEAILTPWIIVFAIMIIMLDILLVDIFAFNGLAFVEFLNNDMDYEWIGCLLALFIVTAGPWVLIGNIIHFKQNMMATFGAFIKKRRLETLINDVPTSTVIGAAVGRVEMAGVALSKSIGSYKHHIAGNRDEKVIGIKNPDNWPILRSLAKTDKKTWDPEYEFEFILHDGSGGINVRMPRKCFEFGEPTAQVKNGIFYKETHWSLDEGDPVFIIGAAKIRENGEVYIGEDKDSELPSMVFKGTEWTVIGKYRSVLEYILADILFLFLLIHIGLILGGVV